MTTESSVKDEVRTTIEHFFQAMDTQDFELIEKTTAHDPEMVHTGTDIGEIWKGWDELRQDTIEQFKELEYYKANIKDLQIHLSPDRNVAWYFHLLDARIKSYGTEHQWQNARFTGVLEKRDGSWVLVQTHVSLPESA